MAQTIINKPKPINGRLEVEKPARMPHSVIKEVFGSVSETAILIAECESGFDSSRVNKEDAKITGYSSWGLFQINSEEFVGWEDPYINTLKAKEIYDRQGFEAWKNCFNLISKNNGQLNQSYNY